MGCHANPGFVVLDHRTGGDLFFSPLAEKVDAPDLDPILDYTLAVKLSSLFFSLLFYSFLEKQRLLLLFCRLRGKQVLRSEGADL